VSSIVVIHRCAEYVGVDKPFDVRIDGGRHDEKAEEPNVAALLREVIEEKVRHCHQLDYATSGAMLYALTKEAARRAAQLFEARLTKKDYIALVKGHLAQDTLVCRAPICQDPAHDFKMMIGEKHEFFPNEPKKRKHSGDATTRLDVIARGHYNNDKVTKVRLTPTSGRRHQLRLHCIHLGHPIVGDATYTNDTASPRMMLHALRLHLPFDHRPPITLETPDPFLRTSLPGLLLDDENG